MNDKKSFSEKLTSFIFGEPIPVLSENDLDSIQHLNGKLDELLAQIDAGQAKPEQPDLHQGQAPGPAAPAAGQHPDGLDDLNEQIRKLAKTQFKANTLQEMQLAQQQETIAGLQKSMEQQEKRLVELNQQRRQDIETAQVEVIKSLLPVLDSLDAAFNSGRRQVLKLSLPVETRRAVIAWLDGIRLARMRLLDVLQTYHVTRSEERRCRERV